MEAKRLLIVGAGLTGSLTATILKKSSLPFTITVWEKANSAGGRMSTHRDPGNPDLCVDMGAQYISRTAAMQPLDTTQEYECLRESLYQNLLSNDVISTFCGWIEGEKKSSSVVQNYISPKGLNSIVKHFLAQSGAEVTFQQHVTCITACIGSTMIPGQVLCKTSADRERIFDGVILTLPVPQLLNLKGNIIAGIDRETLENLTSVKYSCRYALGLFYKDPVAHQGTWSAKYFDDPVIRFAAWDTMKRDCPFHGSSLLLHTSVAFSTMHMEEEEERVKEVIVRKAMELIPGLATSPFHSHIIFWKYSQVSMVYPGLPGCVVLSHDPLVVATGDGFSGSNFENCIKAAKTTAETVVKYMTEKI